MTQTTAAVPYEVSLGFPEKWWSLDLHPSVRDAEVRRRILNGISAQDRVEYADELRDLVRQARHFAAEAHRAGALWIQGLFEVYEGELLMGATTVVRITLPDGFTPDLSELMVAYALRNAGLPLGKGTPAHRTELLSLEHAGPAGRATTIEDIELRPEQTLRMLIMQTLVPLPETNDLLIVASYTPNLDQSDAFLALFESIADSLRLQKKED